MKNLVLSTLAIITLCFSSMSQSFQFRNVTEGVGISVDAVQLSNQDFIVCGVESDQNRSDISLMKLNALGKVKWAKKSASDKLFIPIDMTINESNGVTYMLSKEVNSPNEPSEILYLSKLNEDGQIIWNKTLNASENGIRPISVSILSDGNLLVTSQSIPDEYHKNILVSKISPEGNMIWNKEYGNDFKNNITGNCQLPDESIILFGYTDFEDSENFYDSFIYKLSKEGDGIICQNIKGGHVELGGDVEYNPYNNLIYTAASTKSFNNGDTDIALSTYDIDLNSQWTKVYQGEDFDYAHELEIDQWGNLQIGGSTSSLGYGGLDLLHLKLTPLGDVLQLSLIGGDFKDLGNKSIHTRDNGILMMGYTRSFEATGLDSYVIKLNSRGIGYCNHNYEEEISVIVNESYIVTEKADFDFIENKSYAFEHTPLSFESYDPNLEEMCQPVVTEEEAQGLPEVDINSVLNATFGSDEENLTLSSNELSISENHSIGKLKSLRVLDISGRVVFERKNLEGHESANYQFSDLELIPGIYLVTLTPLSGNSESYKIKVN